jgi:hypothetical protein
MVVLVIPVVPMTPVIPVVPMTPAILRVILLNGNQMGKENIELFMKMEQEIGKIVKLRLFTLE